jgi:hypothetical protein
MAEEVKVVRRKPSPASSWKAAENGKSPDGADYITPQSFVAPISLPRESREDVRIVRG